MPHTNIPLSIIARPVAKATGRRTTTTDAMTPSACALRDNEDPLPGQLYQTALQCNGDSFGPTLAPEFGKNVADMGFDGVFRDMQC